MSKENKNQPAFPKNPDVFEDRMGLTKREYFAGLAMQGILANKTITSYLGESGVRKITERSIQLADELLNQLNHE